MPIKHLFFFNKANTTFLPMSYLHSLALFMSKCQILNLYIVVSKRERANLQWHLKTMFLRKPSLKLLLFLSDIRIHKIDAYDVKVIISCFIFVYIEVNTKQRFFFFIIIITWVIWKPVKTVKNCFALYTLKCILTCISEAVFNIFQLILQK